MADSFMDDGRPGAFLIQRTTSTPEIRRRRKCRKQRGGGFRRRPVNPSEQSDSSALELDAIRFLQTGRIDLLFCVGDREQRLFGFPKFAEGDASVRIPVQERKEAVPGFQ